MKNIFDNVSAMCSKITTTSYSTSFSLGIKFLAEKFHKPIYGIYGFVRFADEIVDTFHEYDKKLLLERFRQDTCDAIDSKISLNPILNSFQHVVHKYGIERELVETFLDSMQMDVEEIRYDRKLYEQYILGSAEVVGLMCLKVFCEGNSALYDSLKIPAMKLGAAFQKVNFLRDIKADTEGLGRLYFPGVDLLNFTASDKAKIEAEIENDFSEALNGIRKLPRSSRSGVYLAYCYFTVLFNKIKQVPPCRILNERIRVPDHEKVYLMFKSYLRHQTNLL